MPRFTLVNTHPLPFLSDIKMNGILIAVLIVTGLLIYKIISSSRKQETAAIRKILPIQKLPVKDGLVGTLVLLLRSPFHGSTRRQ